MKQKSSLLSLARVVLQVALTDAILGSLSIKANSPKA
jgi:hypothetical protein